MHAGFWPVLIITAVIVVLAIAKVVRNMKISEQQWRQVDRSKLRDWKDDDWEDGG